MRSFYLLALVLLLVATLFPIAADAQHQGGGRDPYSQDPGDGCLGPDDPFCSPGDGQGSDSPYACMECQIHSTPDYPYYAYSCASTGASPDTTTFAECTAHSSGCETSRPCSIT